MTRFVALALATSLGVGYVPFAPGTFGSAAGLFFWYFLPHSAVVQLLAILAAFAAGSWAAHIAERHFGGVDPPPVVIDEVMGMWITLFMIPVGWQGALVGFLVFRAFDVIKPYPADRLEHLRGGVGVMADDGMAAVYANIVLRVSVLAAAALWHWAL
jgi:phosphatidylglycerophosphatase A